MPRRASAGLAIPGPRIGAADDHASAQSCLSRRQMAGLNQPTPKQTSNKEIVITDRPVETTTADDTISTRTLYCWAIT